MNAWLEVTMVDTAGETGRRALVRRLASMLVVLTGLAVALTLAPAASAGGVVGDGTPGSCGGSQVDGRVNAALVGGGLVTFDCGGPATIALKSTKNITLSTTIDGGGVITLTKGTASGSFHQLFNVNAGGSLALSNITIYEAWSSNNGGGALRNFGPLTLTNVTFLDNWSSIAYCGGALLIIGDATIHNSAFIGNVAGPGGAICVRGAAGTHVSINDSVFVGNQAAVAVGSLGLGGAVYVEYGHVTIRDGTFVNNHARRGGAIYAESVTATVTLEGTDAGLPLSTNLHLEGNTVAEDGGAIYTAAGLLSIHKALINANAAPMSTSLVGYGGGIYSGGVLTLTDSIVSHNQGRFGGGVFVANRIPGAGAWIEQTIFDGNQAGVSGGGLYANDPAVTVTISNSIFTANTAPNGGGLARFNAALNVYDSAFTGNTATNGGGLLLEAGPSPTDGPTVRVQSVTVSGNTATQGGGVYNTGRVELYSTTIVTNTGGVWSGAGADTHFRNSVLQNPGTPNCIIDGMASVTDDGHNFSTDTSCPLPLSQTGVALDPRLGPLTTDVVGPPRYHMPLMGSPLIDAGLNCPLRDQRGATRVGACDIGAVEYGGVILSHLWLPAVAR
jgi:predicted outer membrane repeat protein